MSTFLRAFFLIVMAEMGDKTQLLTLAFATHLRVRHVLGGVLIGTLANHALAVALGGAVTLIVPLTWVRLASGLSFIGFGLWTLRADRLSGTEEKALGHPLLTVALSFFIAELGDKTQLVTIVLAAQTATLLPVWLGSSLGMLVADGLAVLVGRILGRRLPEQAIRVVASIIFAASGVMLLLEGFSPNH